MEGFFGVILMTGVCIFVTSYNKSLKVFFLTGCVASNVSHSTERQAVRGQVQNQETLHDDFYSNIPILAWMLFIK